MMPFFSFPFLCFAVVAFVAAWYANEKSVTARNGSLLILNAIFYALWDWRMLPALFIGAAVDYSLGSGIERTFLPHRRRILLALGLVNSLGLLLFFKYHGFFVHSLTDGLASMGISVHLSTLKVIVPIGISFYSLQRAGYLIDVYRKLSKAESNIVTFLAFATFFPIILSGPIERSTTLLPQLRIKSVFDTVKIREGFRLFLWGAFKKIVVANSLARIVDGAFSRPGDHSGIELALAAALFSFQLYCDFSGYSEMAMGIARLLGFDITQNFMNPYFSRDIAEFWRRWHVSLSRWLRDYVFFSLGAGYKGKVRWVLNTMITFALCGLWHGANWTFIIWGVLMGIYFIPLIFVNPDPKRPKTVAKGRRLPSWRELAAMTLTFCLVTFSWVFFRADSVVQALHYLRSMFVHSWTAMPNFVLSTRTSLDIIRGVGIVIALLIVLVLEWSHRRRRFALDFVDARGWKRWVIYAAIILFLSIYSGGGSMEFIYADF